MKTSQRVTALAGVLGLGLAGFAASTAKAAPAALPRIQVVGIGHYGHQVPVYATIYTKTDAPIFTEPGHFYRVPRGAAWVGAQVTSIGQRGGIAGVALVMRRVTISRSQTIRLSAESEIRVQFFPITPGMTDQSAVVQACVGGDFVTGPGVSAGQTSYPLYVVPVHSSDLTFGYGDHWQTSAGGYNFAGQSRGGIPSRPIYQTGPGRMAAITLSYRAGEAAGYNNPMLTSNTSCGVGFGLGLNPATGQTQTEYVTPGSWTTELSGSNGFWEDSRSYAAKQSYSNTFGGAVWGPGTESPRSGGSQISFFPDAAFVDPAQPTSDECCDKSSITLSFGGHMLKHRTLDQYRELRIFTAHATKAGWYTLAIKAWRWAPGEQVSNDQLSARENYSWRFYTAPSSIPAGYQREVPAYVAQIVAGGLNIDNQAPAGGSTTLTIHILRTHDLGVPRAHRYALKSVRAWVSFDGKTWQAVSLTGHGGAWLATVQDPASGFVAVRTSVTDARGDSAEQTIYRAYAIG